ncbi:MAG: zinc-finger domain-containing protein [Rickettsiales bacterium]
MSKIEEFSVTSLEIVCSGGEGALGHPKVYLHIEREKGDVTCPYCSRTYVYKPISASYA